MVFLNTTSTISNVSNFIAQPTDNKRLDEWVTVDHFDMSTIQSKEKNKEKNEDNRKLTRTLKRKYEEINHQKVRYRSSSNIADARRRCTHGCFGKGT